MTKWKTFFDFHKEELWLADMSRNGYRLIKGGNGYYKFDYINDRTEYTFKIDYRTFSKEEDFRNYCSMFEDSGWLHVTGTKWSGSQYFVKMKPDAGDDIFSDNLSRAGRYKRISNMWLSLVITFSCTFFFLWLNGSLHINQLYLTPGIWEMKGWHFAKAFAIETPFALFRISPFLIYPFVIAYYAYFTLKSYKLYRYEIKKCEHTYCQKSLN